MSFKGSALFNITISMVIWNEKYPASQLACIVSLYQGRFQWTLLFQAYLFPLFDCPSNHSNSQAITGRSAEIYLIAAESFWSERLVKLEKETKCRMKFKL